MNHSNRDIPINYPPPTPCYYPPFNEENKYVANCAAIGSRGAMCTTQNDRRSKHALQQQQAAAQSVKRREEMRT